MWAKKQATTVLQNHLDEFDARLHLGAALTVENNEDELRLLIDGIVVIELFDQPCTSFIAAQWRQIVRTTNITAKFTGKRLVSLLLALRDTEDDNLLQSIIALDAEIQSLDSRIVRAEEELNRIVYDLYELTATEINLVERDIRQGARKISENLTF